MVDLTPDTQGRTRARLLDLVPGRSGKAYSDWLEDRGKDFRQDVKVATLDPLHGYKNAIDDHLDHTATTPECSSLPTDSTPDNEEPKTPLGQAPSLRPHEIAY